MRNLWLVLILCTTAVKASRRDVEPEPHPLVCATLLSPVLKYNQASWCEDTVHTTADWTEIKIIDKKSAQHAVTYHIDLKDVSAPTFIGKDFVLIFDPFPTEPTLSNQYSPKLFKRVQSNWVKVSENKYHVGNAFVCSMVNTDDPEYATKKNNFITIENSDLYRIQAGALEILTNFKLAPDKPIAPQQADEVIQEAIKDPDLEFYVSLRHKIKNGELRFYDYPSLKVAPLEAIEKAPTPKPSSRKGEKKSPGKTLRKHARPKPYNLRDRVITVIGE